MLAVFSCVSMPVARAFAQDAAAHYCRFVESVAESEALVLTLPRVHGAAGTYREPEGEGGSEVSGTTITARVNAGLEYDVFELYRGLTIGERASADCRRYRAAMELQAFVAAHSELESAVALRESLAVIEAALPEALAFVQTLETELEQGRATLEELSALERGVEALRLERARIRLVLERLAVTTRDAPVQPGSARASVRALLREQERSEQELERYEARLRELQAWSLSLRGGYDHVIGRENDVPVYALVSLSYNFGGLMQSAADERARAARLSWLATQREGLHAQAAEALSMLAALRGSQREQLVQTEARIATLEKRQATVAAVSEGRAREYARQVWLELVHARAEQAYLRRRVAELDETLAEGEVDAP